VLNQIYKYIVAKLLSAGNTARVVDAMLARTPMKGGVRVWLVETSPSAPLAALLWTYGLGILEVMSLLRWRGKSLLGRRRGGGPGGVCLTSTWKSKAPAWMMGRCVTCRSTVKWKSGVVDGTRRTVMAIEMTKRPHVQTVRWNERCLSACLLVVGLAECSESQRIKSAVQTGSSPHYFYSIYWLRPREVHVWPQFGVELEWRPLFPTTGFSTFLGWFRKVRNRQGSA